MISIAQPIFTEAERAALLEVLDSKMLVQGPKVAEFEKRFADYIGTKFGIATSSGTTALTISLMAMGIKPGDEIITTPFTFIATASSIRSAGAVPVFVDVKTDTYNIDPELVNDAISDNTRAIMPVHLYGLSADMKKLQSIASKNNLRIIEDACQAHGAMYNNKKAGSLGDTGCFSFYPTKNMTTGEGGMITTDDEELAEKCRLIRNHGQEARYKYARTGYNYRMTEFAGALGIVQLSKLDEFNSARQKNASRLTELLHEKVQTPIIPPNYQHVFHQYTIKLNSENLRDSLKSHLAKKNIGSEIYYPIGLHEIDFLKGRTVKKPINTEQLTKTVLSLPVHPGLSDDDINIIADGVLTAIGN